MSTGRFSPRSGDRRGVEAELIARLRGLPAAKPPDERFKAELRAQLVAIAPRIMAESAPDADGTDTRPVRRSRVAVLRRPLMAFAGAATVLVLLLGMAIWMAGGSLPGQSLYSIKRASENFQLSVAGSDTGKAMKYLQFATSRAQESSKLVGSDQASPQTATLVATTLRSADADTRNGIRMLGDAAVARQSTAPIGPVPAWLTAQRARIAALAALLPAGPGQAQAARSLALLHQVSVRVSQWKAEIGCSCLSSARSDELGPLPCTSCPVKRPAAGGQPSGPGDLPSGQSTLPVSPLSGLVPAPAVPGSGTPLPSSLPSVPGSLPPAPGSLPPGPGSLPSSLPSAPVAVGSNSATVSLPGLGAGIGTGGVSVSVAPTLP